MLSNGAILELKFFYSTAYGEQNNPEYIPYRLLNSSYSEAYNWADYHKLQSPYTPIMKQSVSFQGFSRTAKDSATSAFHFIRRSW